MDELSKGVIKYGMEDDIFVLNLAGKTNGQKLEDSVKLLRSILETHLGKDSPIKLLIDFRETLWDSEKTHIRTRQVLGKHLQKFSEHRYYFALLNNENSWVASDNEALFTEEWEARAWLRGKQ